MRALSKNALGEVAVHAHQLKTRRKVITFKPCVKVRSYDFLPMLMTTAINVIHRQELPVTISTANALVAVMSKDFLLQYVKLHFVPLTYALPTSSLRIPAS